MGNPIGAPHRLVAALERDEHPVALAREVAHVDLAAPGLVGDERDQEGQLEAPHQIP
jgi:hypothetical protein